MSAAKVSTALAAAKTSSTAGVSAGGAIVVEDDTDFETLEDIANFINSSEPEPGYENIHLNDDFDINEG